MSPIAKVIGSAEVLAPLSYFKTPGKGSTEQTEDDEVFVVDQTSKPVQPVSIEESTGSGAPKGLEETYLNASVGPNPADSGNNTDNPKNEEPLISIVDEGACIATEALKHLPRSSLLYDKHLYSRVLCDKYGSCATGGHMVRFHSRTMMMKSYCIRTTCDERIMFVNSLRYKRKFLVESSSPGLEFTAFAARFETVFEESILGAAHFIGL
ncbi:hypothetical protein BWQ96_07689 [Gracilariopsis chorda]|uniref:Uncharacterized protein n=1 Tax=Gracilariopsis chorda TaxID=448386 RepID=A0A2V3IKG9_9FLOR|nr:hypothetical protein BWQ96_07689 [Gracilariopsis chorda]|eukprot:PXF42594.1 hypothetical protein BWQ96_07689 [Gracilariopsis chorda]